VWGYGKVKKGLEVGGAAAGHGSGKREGMEGEGVTRVQPR
jgi:hypothetical protein